VIGVNCVNDCFDECKRLLLGLSTGYVEAARTMQIPTSTMYKYRDIWMKQDKMVQKYSLKNSGNE